MFLGSVISRCLCQATPSLGEKKEKEEECQNAYFSFLFPFFEDIQVGRMF